MQNSEILENTSSWSFGAGDPTIQGWVIAVAYILCAIICLGACSYGSVLSNRRHHQSSGSHLNFTLFWLSVGMGLLLLGINKQLDIQTLLTDILRSHAIDQGWYEARRIWQKLFILFMGSGALIGCVIVGLKIDGLTPGVRSGFYGFILLTGYVVSRAASFHQFDMALSLEFKGVTILSFAEPIGIAVILVSALRFIRHARLD